MPKIQKTVMVDMDHVLCDFDKRWAEVKIEHPDLAYPQSLPGFFAELDPIEGGVESYKWLSENFDTWILTRASYKNPHCYTDKRLWVEKHLGIEVCPRLIICSEKGLLKGDYLVDDYPWPKFGGTQLKFGRYGEYKTWRAVTDYFKQKYLDADICTG